MSRLIRFLCARNSNQVPAAIDSTFWDAASDKSVLPPLDKHAGARDDPPHHYDSCLGL
jgi:hypothetical protein